MIFIVKNLSLKLGPGICWFSLFTSVTLIIKHLYWVGLVNKKYNISVRLQFVKLFRRFRYPALKYKHPFGMTKTPIEVEVIGVEGSSLSYS
jgi:hypothetical protein